MSPWRSIIRADRDGDLDADVDSDVTRRISFCTVRRRSRRSRPRRPTGSTLRNAAEPIDRKRAPPSRWWPTPSARCPTDERADRGADDRDGEPPHAVLPGEAGPDEGATRPRRSLLGRGDQGPPGRLSSWSSPRKNELDRGPGGPTLAVTGDCGGPLQHARGQANDESRRATHHPAAGPHPPGATAWVRTYTPVVARLRRHPGSVVRATGEAARDSSGPPHRRPLARPAQPRSTAGAGFCRPPAADPATDRRRPTPRSRPRRRRHASRRCPRRRRGGERRGDPSPPATRRPPRRRRP